MEKATLNTETNNYKSRRSSPRLPSVHNVLIQTCDFIGVLHGNFSEQAVTLDYSRGGMRILIDRELPSASLLRFDFGNDFVIPQLQGIAKICWHRKVEDKDHGIEAGLAFQDHFSQEVLSAQVYQ
ncbi:MAG: PilZ domain-containing protein [Gammaproteobacteria bacterium]|nr:PilZ domain-containing protein [Gammaproteobacteria bacterium]